MALLSNQRGSRTERTQDGLIVSHSGIPVPKKKWSNLLPLFVALAVIAEIGFLSKLDMAKNVAMVDSWADVFYWRREVVAVDDLEISILGANQKSETGSCEDWLEREDAVTYSRDFAKKPILVVGAKQEWRSCSVGCRFGFDVGKPDAQFGLPHKAGTASVLRSMESAQYYAENNIDMARRRGYDIAMTTSLSSDVPVGYFSWAEYDLMAPVQPKTETALAAAFISNCGARNFRLQALEALEKENIKIDSYGGCHRNRDGNVNKVEALKRYKFSLAFENSNEEDYVTEKFFQSLVVGLKISTEPFPDATSIIGSVPVVVGAPNIEDFAPSPGSVLHIKELANVKSVAMTMRSLAENPEAYNQSLRWKYDGPSDSFKALVDMAAVHSSCRLCIHLATMIREKEEKSSDFKKRPCKCTRGSETVYHIYVRERGRFEMESIYLSDNQQIKLPITEYDLDLRCFGLTENHRSFIPLANFSRSSFQDIIELILLTPMGRSSNLTLESMKSAVISKFTSLNHVPVWKEERPESIRGGTELKVYRIYPVGLTQRQALYTFRFKGDADFRSHLETKPCAKFEVIFV